MRGMTMQMMNWLAQKLRTRIKEREEAAVIRAQLKEVENSLESERASYWEGKFDPEELQQRFHEAGIATEAREVDVRDFEMWMAENPSLVDFYQVSGEARIEKILEHYLSVRCLGLRETDVIIDIAAAGSPFAQALRQNGMNAYRLDLSYPPGLRGYEIGSDAGNMPLPDGFADVLTLHCAFECFQGESDVSFAVEAARVLKKGGRLGIVPLYVDTVHFVKTSPWCDRREIKVEPEAMWLWRDDKYRAPFSRHYSPESFSERIALRMKGMDMKVLRFMNLHELSKIYPGQRVYSHFMFKAVKP
jgi:SAM-dependent methyltransferase